MKTLNINPAYANLIPPLSAEEFQGLEESILAYGQCRDAIKAWKGTIVRRPQPLCHIRRQYACI